MFTEGESAQCVSCRLTRQRPDPDHTIAPEKLAEVGVAKRRLLVQLFTLGLPAVGLFEKDGGLAFDLLSSVSGEQVVIGHADGRITIELAEGIDARREAIERHHRLGAPDVWAESSISEYATMHPWEDFAETFAHHLHIRGRWPRPQRRV